ncbi:MAG: LysR family transcriptional regulator [Gammaproteobacteria bacterium]|nr:LysR family transcriptional regulator [Gammaproteobacteria bacterium]NIR85000.1 LysR family transcriptional regulator [Gammaproteobacteria bacterium]NIR88267.1 LysR family transcriptional regulator [Gammaproteobacteria bacterium]NIU06047.1 LysR family transcriptional regulator [Gammaproteobacteria bacterium]NIV73466.1 LysR family transcriptional regulator [Gammaproteobacteria bacterium]
MNLRQLQYFVQTAETGSISKAATRLSVAQPAISRQVRSLEEELAVRLLYRNGRGVSMTEAGRILFNRARVILDDVRRAEWEIRELAGVATGQVTLGAPPTVSQVLVIPLIKRLLEDHPNVSLQVVEAFSGYVQEWLANGRLDVAVLYNAPRTKHLETEQLLRENLFLVTSAAGGTPPPTVDVRELESVPLVLPSPPHGLRLLVDQVAGEAGMQLKIGFEIDALPAIKELVEDGVGASILPFASVHREVSAGRMNARQIVNPRMSRTLVCATSTQRPLSLAARVVIGELKSVVHSLVEEGTWKGVF